MGGEILSNFKFDYGALSLSKNSVNVMAMVSPHSLESISIGRLSNFSLKHLSSSSKHEIKDEESND